MPKDWLDDLLEIPEKPMGFWRELWMIAWAGMKIFLACALVLYGLLLLFLLIPILINLYI